VPAAGNRRALNAYAIQARARGRMVFLLDNLGPARGFVFVIATPGANRFSGGASENSSHMHIEKTSQGDHHELVISGRIDGEGANQLEIALLKTISAGAKAITVELSGATFLCSAGLRALLQYWRQMQGKQGTLQVTNPSPEAMALLNTSGFKDMLIQKA